MATTLDYANSLSIGYSASNGATTNWAPVTVTIFTCPVGKTYLLKQITYSWFGDIAGGGELRLTTTITIGSGAHPAVYSRTDFVRTAALAQNDNWCYNYIDLFQEFPVNPSDLIQVTVQGVGLAPQSSTYNVKIAMALVAYS